jgi:hypothetical protein
MKDTHDEWDQEITDIIKYPEPSAGEGKRARYRPFLGEIAHNIRALLDVNPMAHRCSGYVLDSREIPRISS